MALTRIQRDVMAAIAANRSESSYLAGGAILNMDWPRLSDDIDIFHDADEEIDTAAQIDIATLRAAGFVVTIDVRVYGCVEASVMRTPEATLIQWMSESRTRFFPLVRDDEWGARLHRADLAVNKVLAASTRTKARDYADLLTISREMCPLGPLMMAASGKPPHFSPLRIVDDIRRKCLSVPNEEYAAVRGLPIDWSSEWIRNELLAALDAAEHYVREAPTDLVGVLAVDRHGQQPVLVTNLKDPNIQFRRATAEHEVVPSLPETPMSWNSRD